MAAIRDAEFQLVISDLSLPDADGTELIEQIRAAAPGTEVLAISGFMAGMSRSALLAAGASETLAKPTSPRKLIGCVRAVLDAQFAPETKATTSDHLRCLVACGARFRQPRSNFKSESVHRIRQFRTKFFEGAS